MKLYYISRGKVNNLTYNEKNLYLEESYKIN